MMESLLFVTSIADEKNGRCVVHVGSASLALALVGRLGVGCFASGRFIVIRVVVDGHWVLGCAPFHVDVFPGQFIWMHSSTYVHPDIVLIGGKSFNVVSCELDAELKPLDGLVGPIFMENAVAFFASANPGQREAFAKDTPRQKPISVASHVQAPDVQNPRGRSDEVERDGPCPGRCRLETGGTGA